MLAAFDHYIPIHQMSDEQAAKIIFDEEVDILIDLHGITSGARPNILFYRPAPVQITYLGFPGTTGHPCIDYVIADKYLVPEEYKPFYSEKIIYMPDIFQCSDSMRIVGPTPKKSDYGLPEDKFIFCSFNNNYKITPEIFTAWMEILKGTPNSILWLLEDNHWAKRSMIEEAEKLSVDPARLYFAGRVSPENYLARYKLADLFLDCYPFNGGTTVNDALWVGLPVLTLSGRSFASRMAGSLLNASEMSIFITNSFSKYIIQAINFYSKNLKYNINTKHEFFDSIKFTKQFENLLFKLKFDNF
jgi:predicted O-linked N-acetylglucosamine transferase (SPINDLY family)